MLIRSHILSLCLIAIIGLLLSVLWVQRAVLELSPTQAANFVSAVIKWQWPEHHNNLERAEMRYDWRKMRLQVEINTRRAGAYYRIICTRKASSTINR